MPDIISCPSCGGTVSRFGRLCPHCWEEIVPALPAVTAKLIDGLLDDAVADVCFGYVSNLLRDAGCWERSGPPARDIVAALPTGLLAGYLLVVLESEVLNGGFHQWLTNSSGELADETLEAAKAIRATRCVTLLRRALKIDREFGADFPWYADRFRPQPPHCPPQKEVRALMSKLVPPLEELDKEWGIQDGEVIWGKAFLRYVRKHPESCVHPEG